MVLHMQEPEPKILVDEIVITLQPMRAKRITPWGATCNACGFLGAAHKKKKSVERATEHANKIHKGTASLRLNPFVW